MKMTNRWNRLIYKFWSPVYDLLFDHLLFASGRKRTFELLQLRGAERVLLVGVGTGADVGTSSPDCLNSILGFLFGHRINKRVLCRKKSQVLFSQFPIFSPLDGGPYQKFKHDGD